MNVTIITQDDKFYLYEPLKYLILELKKSGIQLNIMIVKAGLKKSSNQVQEKLKILQIFGLKFTIYYFIMLIYRSVCRKSITQLCNEIDQPAKFVDNINCPQIINELKNQKVDLIVSVTCNQIFKQELLDTPRIGVLNLHTSKLPAYRGVMPTFWALKNGEEQIGVSVFWVDAGIDTGPIARSAVIKIKERRQSSLIRRTKKIGAELILAAIDDIQCGRIIRSTQDQAGSSYYGFPKRKDVILFRQSNKFF